MREFHIREDPNNAFTTRQDIDFRDPDLTGVSFKTVAELPEGTSLEDAKEAVLNFLRLGMDLEPGHET